jgi:hypothetical protein
MEPFIINSPQRDLLPGDVGFYTIAGRVGGLVSLGQSLLRDECRFTHAFIVVKGGPATPVQCVEAMPGGARLAPVSDRVGTRYGYARLPLSQEQRDAITPLALELIAMRYGKGIGYSFADYLALAMQQWQIPGRNLLRNYVSTSKRMICSQLVDFVLCEAGFHLFTDGRLPQDVTPGDLWWQAGAIGRAAWWPVGGYAKSVVDPFTGIGGPS